MTVREIECCVVACDNNTGFGNCMFGVTEELIKTAKNINNEMCAILRHKVLEIPPKERT